MGNSEFRRHGFQLFVVVVFIISRCRSDPVKIKKPRTLPYTPDPALAIPRNTTRRLIILLTSFRGGSTFLGKLFDENPAVQYFFEPFHNAHMKWMFENKKLEGTSPRHTYKEWPMFYLRQVAICQDISPSWVAYVEKWRLCGAPEENRKRFGSDQCPENLNTNREMVNVCKIRDTSVVKVIRMRRLSDIFLIRNIRDMDVRIVHSIRHPAGSMRSRVGWGQFNISKYRLQLIESWYTKPERHTLLAWEAHTYCADVMATLRLVSRDPWLRDRYLSVTHRQLSLEPVRTARSIYEHVGLEMSAELEQFVRNTTQGDASDENKDRAYLTTSKVSKDVVTAWRKMDKLDRREIKAISSVCSDLLLSMGEQFPFEPLDLDDTAKLFYPADVKS